MWWSWLRRRCFTYLICCIIKEEEFRRRRELMVTQQRREAVNVLRRLDEMRRSQLSQRPPTNGRIVSTLSLSLCALLSLLHAATARHCYSGRRSTFLLTTHWLVNSLKVKSSCQWVESDLLMAACNPFRTSLTAHLICCTGCWHPKKLRLLPECASFLVDELTSVLASGILASWPWTVMVFGVCFYVSHFGSLERQLEGMVSLTGTVELDTVFAVLFSNSE